MLRLAFGLLSLAAAAAFQAGEAGPPFPRIANCYGVGLKPDSTPADIEEIARFDLLIGGVWCDWGNPGQRQALAAALAAVRQRNPHILVLDFSSSAPYHYPNDTSFPAGGWLRQPDGKHVLGWPGTEMINLRQAEVLDFLVARSLASVRDRGFDGTFIDCMGSGFDAWACNIASGTAWQVDADGDGRADDRAWLDREWVRAKTELAGKVRGGLGEQPVFITNQAGDWGRPTMNGILLEDYLDYVLAGTMRWEQVLRDYLAWTAAPHRPNVTTIVSSSGVEPPFDPWKSMPAAEREALLGHGRGLTQRMRFGLTTTLMGDGYFAYDLHTRWRGQRWWYPEYDAPLGYPKAPGTAAPDGSWRRAFDGGTVVVNPTLFDVPVRFNSRHRDASSGRVATEFVVPTLDGRIFLPTAEAPAAGTFPDLGPALTFAGPEPVVVRGDRVLCRFGGAVALFDECGRLLAVTDGQRTLLEQVRPFIVRDDRWHDFAYEAGQAAPLPDGGVGFRGRRTEPGVVVAYELDVRPGAGELRLTYRWEALTDAHFHMFRQQADLPVTVYGGGSFQAGTVSGSLPGERAPKPVLAAAGRELVARPPVGPGVALTLSGDAALVDERHYGVDGYRIGLHPAPRDPRRGERWEYSLSVRVMPPQ